MAVPKKKISKSKRNSRRAHDGINKISISFDSVTGEPKLPHHISLKDGYYNGKQLIKPKAKGDNKESENTKEEDTKKIKAIEKEFFNKALKLSSFPVDEDRSERDHAESNIKQSLRYGINEKYGFNVDTSKFSAPSDAMVRGNRYPNA